MSRPDVPRLHLIGPLDTPATAYPEIACSSARGGVDAIHVRLPGAPAVDVLALARRVDELRGSALAIVNDRLDIALLVGAGGVQLGERSFSVPDARRLLGPNALIGRSVHDVDGARVAAADGADFLLAGNVFATPSHPDQPGRGLGWLAELCHAVPTPVIAIGGINAARLPDVLQAGAHGAALGRELLSAPDPTAMARQLRTLIDRAANPSALGPQPSALTKEDHYAIR